MPHIQKSIDINSPAEEVFELLSDPNRLPEYTPGVTGVEDVHQSGRHIGDSFKANYSVMGLHIPMTFTATAYEKPTKLAVRFEGGMKGNWTWTLEPRGNATHMDMQIDYDMGGGILGKAVNALLLERMNEKNAERFLEDLKMVSEAAS